MCTKLMSNSPLKIRALSFDKIQANILMEGARKIAELGGPDAKDAHGEAMLYAQFIKNKMHDKEHLSMLNEYATGVLSALIFENLPLSMQDKMPLYELDKLEDLTQDIISLELASRNQILLALVQNQAFAYDIDNNGKIVRLVGNFNGGGINKLKDEANTNKINLSSHSGVSLGAHTEAPYHTTWLPMSGHSPAPSTLILTARYNPKDEPTTIIPLNDCLDGLEWNTILGLTLPVFSFSRSDSFTAGQGEGATRTPLLNIDEQGRIAIKFNVYRVYVEEEAPQVAKLALTNLVKRVNSVEPIKINLQPDSAIAINNYNSLHCRDTVKDNRRLLIRLFGYSRDIEYIVLSQDPLLVRG